MKKEKIEEREKIILQKKKLKNRNKGLYLKLKKSGPVPVPDSLSGDELSKVNKRTSIPAIMYKFLKTLPTSQEP